MVELATETVFTWGAPPVKFGAGAADELAHDLGHRADATVWDLQRGRHQFGYWRGLPVQ